jgi:anti-sigma factor ChrR (cupin superfamily)
MRRPADRVQSVAMTTPTAVHADFDQRVVIHPGDAPWLASPEAGVERRMLDRVGGEVARATSVVRYLPGARFARHVHGGGEEFLVLDGVFSDERGDYPAGWYVRNPPGSAHAPFSVGGCVIFVKLRQFADDDLAEVRVDTRAQAWRPGLVSGLTVMPLHSHAGVDTALVRWAPHTRFSSHVHPGGEEIYVLDGVFHDEHGAYPAGSWLRSPPWSRHTPFTEGEGAQIYVKTGHLAR